MLVGQLFLVDSCFVLFFCPLVSWILVFPVLFCLISCLPSLPFLVTEQLTNYHIKHWGLNTGDDKTNYTDANDQGETRGTKITTKGLQNSKQDQNRAKCKLNLKVQMGDMTHVTIITVWDKKKSLSCVQTSLKNSVDEILA